MRLLLSPSAVRIALGLLAPFILPPAWAEDPVAEYNAIKRASLKGIESLDVIALGAKEDSGCHQVSGDDIESEVEARLERAGIPLTPPRKRTSSSVSARSSRSKTSSVDSWCRSKSFLCLAFA
jgi:hypothetical protein